MIIKPSIKSDTDSDKSPIKNGFELGEDEWGRYLRKIRFLISPDKKSFRRDTIEKRLDEDYVYRDCCVGSLLTPGVINNRDLGRVDGFMYSTINTKNGEIIQSGTDMLYPAPNPVAMSHVYTGDFGIPYPPYIGCGNMNTPNISDLIGPLPTGYTENLIDTTYDLEDVYQMRYLDLIGAINTFFTAWNYTYPFECHTVIDCHTGLFNVPKFKYLPGIDKNVMQKIYVEFMNGVSDLTELLYDACHIEKRNLRIYSYIGIGGTVVKIKDIDRKAISVYPYNATDHINTIMADSVNGGVSFLGSRIYDTLDKIKRTKYVSSEMIERTYPDMVSFTNFLKEQI